jgi:hypothetical protein
MRRKLHAMFFILIKSRRSSGLFFFLILFPFILRSQVIQSGRIELPIQYDIETYSAISLDTSGIVLHRSFAGAKEDQLELTRLDTGLHQVWKGFLPIPKGLTIAKTKASDGKIYFFFKNSASGGKSFTVFVVKIKDGGYSSYSITNLIPFNATEFIVSNDALLIAGYFNFRPIVLHYSIKDQHARILPGFLNEPGELTQIKTYPDGNLDVIVSAKNNNRKKCLWIRHFDKAGDLIKTVVLEPEENKNLIFGRAVKMANDNQVIAGVYGRNSEYSRGIFVAEINTYGEYIIRYYNFADLQNFFHYMKAKREKRIKERIERRRIKGKKIKFNYRFLVHELIPYGNQFVMLGEAFYPTYTNRSNFYGTPVFGNFSPWNYGLTNRYNNSYRGDYLFDGFQYTHAVVIGFDREARLVWDNSFEINGIKSFQLEQFVKIFASENKIALLYLYENLIRSKVIKGSQVVEGTTQDPIMTSGGLKPQKNNIQTSKLEYWYGNQLFVYGIQNFKSPVDNINNKVFFINKIRVH